MKRIYIYWCLFFLIAYGCITEFTPKGIDEVADILVVEGTISSDSTIIRLSKSIGLYDEFSNYTYIQDAQIYVQCDDGTIYNDFHVQAKGTYVIKTGTLKKDAKYSLFVSYNGSSYQSEYLSPLFTPEIDSISSIKRGKGEPVYICVNTHDPEDQSRYYKWSYRENWEVHAELEANVIADEWGNLVDLDITTSNNLYYCWGQDSSRVLLLGNANKLSENIISENRIIEMAPGNKKISYLYHLAVEQTMIRKEAYDYFYNLQKNMDSTGGIFATMPNEMKGNITCITNPDEPVIGYIEVATTTSMEGFIPTTGLYEGAANCYLSVTDDPESNLPVYYKDMLGRLSYAPQTCFDCRQSYRASKNKPHFWPNNHL